MPKTPYILIMAGGLGSRFWPASREHLPKQFLDITGSGRTLIQMTFDRFASFVPPENIFIITNDSYRTQTLEAVKGILEENIITEPSRNNTAASIALATFKLIKNQSDAVCIVAPADHIIQDQTEFEKAISLAVEHAGNHHSIVTLGITPTRPDTGYGYIEYDKEDAAAIRKVKSFREKPDATTAQNYVEAGNFVWNSGIFIWRLDDILQAYKMYSKEIYDILAEGENIYNTDKETEFLKINYPRTQNISVDYAILEQAQNVFTIPCEIGWSDLGTWTSLFEIGPKDENNNALLTNPVYGENTTNSVILSKNAKLVVIKGLENYIIVDTDDCLLIYPKSEEQSIKALKEKLKDKGLDTYL